MNEDQFLSIIIKLGLIGQDKAEEARAALKGVADTTTDATGATQKLSDAGKEATGINEKEKISLREKHEVVRALTQAFPELREAALFALNPITLAAFAIGGAFEIFKKRVEAATEALSDVEMPDLTTGIDQANQLATAWDGVKRAVDEAIQKYNSPENVFGRQKKDIDEQTASTKKLLDAEKERALGQLDAQKDKMGPADYAARKAQIENSFEQQSIQADEQARQQELAAKYRERANAEIAAQTAGAGAGAIKLPESDDAFKAQQEALGEKVKSLQETVAAAQKEKDFLAGLGSKGLVENQEDYYQFYEKYGRGQSIEGAMQIQNKRESDAREQIEGTNREITRREREKADRDRLRSTAEQNSGLAATLGQELPDDRANANAQTVAQLRQHIVQNAKHQDELRAAAAGVIEMNSAHTQIMIQTFNQLRADMQKSIEELKSRVNRPQGQ